jgi:hypothetical protein
MPPLAQQNYTKFLTDMLHKFILIFGPSVSLIKARRVEGLSILENGDVTAVSGDPQEKTQQFINLFMEISPQVVKKTIEEIIISYPGISLTNIEAAPDPAQAKTQPDITSSPATEPTQTPNNPQ